MPITVEGINRIARMLRDFDPTCTVLTEDADHAREIFDGIKAITPIVGVISRTGFTLHLTAVTENVNKYGHNQRINHATSLKQVRQVWRTEAERVWT